MFNETVFPGLTTSVQLSSPSYTSTFSPKSRLNTLLTLHCCTQSQSAAFLDNTNNLSNSSSLSTSPNTLTYTFPLPNSPIQTLLMPHLPMHSTSTSVHIPDSDYSAPILDDTTITNSLALSPDTTELPLPSHITREPSLSSNLTSVNPNTTSQYLMQTSSKSGIHKPKMGYAAQVDYAVT